MERMLYFSLSFATVDFDIMNGLFKGVQRGIGLKDSLAEKDFALFAQFGLLPELGQALSQKLASPAEGLLAVAAKPWLLVRTYRKNSVVACDPLTQLRVLDSNPSRGSQLLSVLLKIRQP